MCAVNFMIVGVVGCSNRSKISTDDSALSFEEVQTYFL
jgi:hypothetical protein